MMLFPIGQINHGTGKDAMKLTGNPVVHSATDPRQWLSYGTGHCLARRSPKEGTGQPDQFRTAERQTLKKRLELTITSEKSEGKDRTCRIIEAPITQ